MTPEHLRITSEPKAAPSDIALVKDALYEFNMLRKNDHHPHPINLFVRDESNVIYAGLLANCWGRWVHIDFLWVSEEVRSIGLGTKLLNMAHDEARSFGCLGAYLETYTFQARPFYERFGYRVVGEIKDFPPGETYFFMAKTPL